MFFGLKFRNEKNLLFLADRGTLQLRMQVFFYVIPFINIFYNCIINMSLPLKFKFFCIQKKEVNTCINSKGMQAKYFFPVMVDFGFVSGLGSLLLCLPQHQTRGGGYCITLSIKLLTFPELSLAKCFARSIKQRGEDLLTQIILRILPPGPFSKLSA